MILQLRCDPTLLPAEIKFGTYGDRYLFKMTHEDQSQEFEAIRYGLNDNGNQTVTLQVAALPAQVGDNILYAPNDTTFLVEHEALLATSDIIPLTPESRNSTFRRFHIICQEPGFWEYMRQYDEWNLLSGPFALEIEKQDAALEVYYRIVQCHSRSEIRTNAAVCERTERLLRAYRSSKWTESTRGI
ncbi:hypothetical protein [Microvirga tunisiensis]|uniref:Uncharacterized protein n=1 Tax=Microvirga tunisiensis TaxID=2108360 RepID=A0A5N7MB48_9HYPH|nr:hypothetical protein [Microvirga tunisiensis]MPR05660.1 hypothetical protein [Microvirga tunisiensis]MPR23860.1 hypothetical protein [Microvirga tunisiensis]